MLSLRLVFLVLISRSLQACNNSRVFSLPVTNVTLSNRQLSRGVPMSVGSPAQNMSMLPQAYLNDTWLYNSSVYFCNSNWTSDTGCITARGGLYNPGQSSTSQPAANVLAAGGDQSDTLRTTDLHIWDNTWVNDQLVVGDSNLTKFPLGMPGFPIFDTYDTQSQFGLGLNSTLLNALQSANAITSRAYSWWWGLQGVTSQEDGHIVFGGYDAARVTGNNYTQALSAPSFPSCNSGMQVTISDIVLTFPNATTASILSPNQLVACILPDYPLILTLPYEPYYVNFGSLTDTQSFGYVGGNGLAFGGMGYYPDDVFQGSLTIEINNAISIEFPNELLVVPPSNVDTSGMVQANNSVREVLLSGAQGVNQNDHAILGRHFFQAAYLMVDYDSHSFTLWNANTSSTGKNLVPPPSNCTSSQDATVSTSTGVTSNNADPENTSGRGLSAGAIAGIAVGAICALSAAIGVVLYYRRRRNKAEKEKHVPNQVFQVQQRDGFHGFMSRHEAMENNISELNGHEYPVELTTEANRLELPSSGSWHTGKQWTSQSSPAELG